MHKIEKQMQVNHDYELAEAKHKARLEKDLVCTAKRMLEKHQLSAFAFIKICEKNNQPIF